MADLPWDDEIERHAERVGDLRAQHDTTARQREHHPFPSAVSGESLGEPPAGVCPVSKPHVDFAPPARAPTYVFPLCNRGGRPS